MGFKIKFVLLSGATITTESIISLKFTKERYTPYTKLSGRVWLDSLGNEVKCIYLNDGQSDIHVGIADNLSFMRSEGKTVVSFSSRGFSCALAHNQITPGLYSNVKLANMLGSFSLPYVTYESMANPIDYIFIKENDSMWDAAAAFARKLSGDYPYIYKTNNVRITRNTSASPITIPTAKLITQEIGQNYTRVISHLHMKDLEGSYNTYNLENSNATTRQLIRHRHIAFDRQWLSNPDEAMSSVIDYSMRGMRYKKLSLEGYVKAELRQLASVTCDDFNITSQEISKIELSMSDKGVITTLWFYEDSYSQ